MGDDGLLLPWASAMAIVDVERSLMNEIVFDYLATEGYMDAARAFARETGTTPDMDLSSIGDRNALRESIEKGQVQEAIHRLAEIDPGILRDNQDVAFALKQQALLEMIRAGEDMAAALAYAQQELAPAAADNPVFLEDLEHTMALLAFEDGTASPVGHLLDPAQRRRTACSLNRAMLQRQLQQSGTCNVGARGA